MWPKTDQIFIPIHSRSVPRILTTSPDSFGWCQIKIFDPFLGSYLVLFFEILNLLYRNNLRVNSRWTGADSNPRNNAGQGQAGTDRSNICLLRANKYVKSGATKAGEKAHGHYASSYPDTLGNTELMGLSLDRRIDLCASGMDS